MSDKKNKIDSLINNLEGDSKEKTVKSRIDSLINNLTSIPEADIPIVKEAFQSTELPGYSTKQVHGDFGQSQYDKPLTQQYFQQGAYQEQRAQEQTKLDRWSNAVPRILSKALTETAKTPGYLYAIGESMKSDVSLADALNNSWINSLEHVDQKTKEQFAIYTPKAVKEGNLWDNLTSASFYTNEGADGLGYLLGLLAPGAALKSLGLGARTAKILGGSAKLGQNLEIGQATLMNTTLESAAEAKGLVDSLKQDFKIKLEKGEINPTTNKPWTEQEVNEAIGQAGVNSFMTNFALLLGPDFIMNKNLLGKALPDNVSKYVDANGKFLDIDKVAKKSALSEYSKKIGTGVFSEGFIEEAGQFAIEDYNKKLAKGETKSDYLVGLLDSYGEALTTTEGQKSIFLGGLFGGLGAIRGAKEDIKTDRLTSNIMRMLKDNYEGFSSSTQNLYEKNQDGSVKLDKQNQPVLNIKSISDLVTNIGKETNEAAIKDIYTQLNNKEGHAYISNAQFTRFALPYLSVEGGVELLSQHIDHFANELYKNEQLQGEELINDKQYRTQLKQKAKELKKQHDNIQSTFEEINIGVPIDNTNKRQYIDYTNKVKNAALQEVSKQLHLNDRINSLSREVGELTLSLSGELPQNKVIAKQKQEQIDSYQKDLKKSIDKYEKLFDPKEHEKAFKEYQKVDKKVTEVIEKIKEEVKEKETKESELESKKTDIEKRKQNELVVELQNPNKTEESIKQINSKYDAELANLTSIKEDKTKTPELIDPEDPKEINKQEAPEESKKSLRAHSYFKTESGKDDGTNPNSDRYFRYVEKNKVADHRLLVVTKNNNLKLYNEILSIESEQVREFNKKNPNYQGIYTVLVDKDNNIIKVDNKPVFTTLTTVKRIEDGEIVVEDKQKAIEELTKFRSDLLAQTEQVYLTITGKSKGIVSFLPTINGERQSKSVIGSLSDRLEAIQLELPTLAAAGERNLAYLKNGQVGYTGKLYAYTSTNTAIDLIPRNVNSQEAEILYDLILQRMGLKQKTVLSASKEIDKLIYFGISKRGISNYTIGVNKDKTLQLGQTKLTTDQVNSPEGKQAILDFLANKRVSVLKRNFDEPFEGPTIDEQETPAKKYATYKEYLLLGEDPMFGTDIQPKSEVQYRNQYLIYDPAFKTDKISTSKNVVEEEMDLTVDKEQVKQAEKSADSEELKKTFKRKTKGTRKLDRLTSVTTSKTLLTQEERTWFKSNFPNIPIEEVQGLIENKALGQFISSGKVLLSSEAVIGTLYHEAFHTTTQLYLTKTEIKALYKEARIKLKKNKLSDLEIEEILAEDFANYKTTGKILGERFHRNNIFRRLLNFIKNLLNIPASSIDEIYQRIDKGYYAKKDIVGVRQFDKLYKALPGKSETYTKELLDGIDALYGNVLFEDLKTPNQAFGNVKKEALDNVFDDILALQEDEKEKKTPNIEVLKNLNYALENWDLVIKQWQERNNSLYIETIKEEVIDENEEKSVEEENTNQRSGEAYQEANTISTKSTMSKASKMLIRTLNQVGKVSSFGTPLIVDFTSTYNYLLKETANLTTYSEIYNRIEELSKTRLEFKDLLKRIGKPSSSNTFEQFIFQQQFRQDFSKNKNTSQITMFEANGNIYVQDANKFVTSERIKEEWKNNIRHKSNQNTQGKLIIDTAITKGTKNSEFLKKLGITISKETPTDTVEFNESVQAIRNYIINQNGNVTDLFTPEADVYGRINELLNIELEYNTTISELSYVNSEGKTVYSIGQNNALSMIKNIINNSKTKTELFERLPHLNTISTEGSVFLDKLFDEKGNKRKNAELIIDLHDGVRSDSKVKNKISLATRKLTSGDKYVQELNSILLHGRSSYIRASDKSTEHAISINNKPLVPIEQVEEGFNTKLIKDIFNDYFKAELKRIAFFRLQDIGKDIDNYGYTINKKGKQVGNKGADWTIFEGILSKDIKSDINIRLEELKSQNLTTEEIKEELNVLFDELIDDVEIETIEFLEKYEKELSIQLDKYLVGKNNKGFSKKLLKRYSKEQLIRATVVNDYINSIEQTKLFTGDMSFYKDIFKRSSAFTGTKESMSTGLEVDEWLNNNNKRKDKKIADGKINVLIYEDVNISSDYLDEYIEAFQKSNISIEDAEVILQKYTDMDEGDAQGWITLDELREASIRGGTWKIEDLFDKIQNKETLTEKELKRVFLQVKKYQYSGPQVYDNIFAPAYHKYSLLPLIPQMVKGKNLEKLLNHMTKNQIGYALFKSGSKVGTRVNPKTGKTNSFYNENGEINEEASIKQQIYYDFLGTQVKESLPKNKVIFGTQFRKLLFSNLFQQGKVTNTRFEELFKEYSKIIEDIINNERTKLVEELGLSPNNYTSKNVSKLVETLRKEAKDRNLADNIRDSLKTEEIEGKLLLAYKFDAMVNKSKIDNMITAIINSRLIKQKTYGDALTQVSSAGFETLGKREIGSNSALKFYRKDPNTGKTLPAECMIPMRGQYLMLLKQYGSLETVNQAIRDNKIDSRILSLVGYRIPTQGLNSIETLTIKEFLPSESATSIVLPTEIVAKSGGDFDVDKLNIFKPNLTINKIKKVSYLKDTKEDEASIKFLKDIFGETVDALSSNENRIKQNRIIEIAKEVLEHEDNFIQLITPNSTKILTDIVKEMRYIDYINKSKEKNPNKEIKITKEEYNKKLNEDLSNIRYTNQLKLTTKIQQFIKYLTAKDMIGIAAIQNVHNILAQIKGLTLNNSYINKEGKSTLVEINLPHNKTEEGLIDLGNQKDVDNNHNISEVNSQVINATVDAAKDPFMFDMNMTMETLSTYLFLTRIGVPFENISYFMKQPIISAYLQNKNIHSAGFLKITGEAEDLKKLTNKLIYEYKDKLSKIKNFKYRKQLDDYLKSLPKKQFLTEELKNNLSIENQNTAEFYESQIQILNDYLHYKELSQLLSQGIKATNHDTNGLGKNLYSAELKKKQIQEVRNTKFINGIDDILNNTFIKAFDQNQFAIDALSQFYYIYTNKDISPILNNLINKINLFKDEDKIKLATLVENDLITYVVQNYGYENISEIQNKLFNTESVAKELLTLKNKTNKNIEEQKIVDNLLIKELYPLLAKAAPNIDNIKIYVKRYDSYTANQLTEAFRELKNLKPDLAKRLMDLGILQSGLNNSPITYLGLIPYEYYNELVKKAFDNFDKKNGVSELYKFTQLFLRNNSKNSLIYKTAKKLKLADENKLGFDYYGKDYNKNKYSDKLKNIEQQEETEEQDYISGDLEEQEEDLEENKQLSLFSEEFLTLKQEFLTIKFEEEQTSGYRNRTIKNASADATIALAVDFTSAGEKLTKSSVLNQNKKYIPIDANNLEVTKERVDKIVEQLNSISKTEVKGINIYSKSSDILGKRLTNPNWYAKDLMDVESPYKAGASKITAKHLSSEDALKYDMDLMYKLQVQKFHKNPELIDEINERGGLQFILNSEHTVGVRGSRWEGKGTNSNFIKVLAKSYTTVAKELGKFKDEQQSKGISLNIAGNGIYTMKGKYTQQQVDDFTYDLLNQVINSPNLKTKIESIRSGGQTGFDEAGAKAGIKLGLPTIVLAPKGWTFRNITGKDISNEKQFKERFKKDDSPQYKKDFNRPKRTDYNAPSFLNSKGKAYGKTKQEADNRYIDLKRIYPRVDKPYRLDINNWVINVPMDQYVSNQFPQYKTEETEDTITEEEATNLVKDLTKRLGVKANFITKEEAKKLLGDKYNNEPAFYYKGEIYLTRFDKDDILHEMSHPILDSLVENNKELFTNIIDQIAKENPEIVKEVEELYSDQSEITQLKEIAVRGLTKLAKQNITKKSGLERLWNEIVNLIKNIFGLNEIDIKDLSPNTNLQELADLISKSNTKIKLEEIVSEEEQFKREKKKEQDSPFKEQIVFFNRRLKALEKQLNKLKINSPEWEKVNLEITELKDKFEAATELQNQELFNELGSETLDKVESYVDALEKGEARIEDKNIEYAKDVITVFRDFKELAKKVLELKERLMKFFKELTLKHINEYRTEKEVITQEQIDSQNKDINKFTKGVGALSDVNNYIARTIGLIIKAAQNRGTTKKKQAQKLVQDEIDLLHTYSKKNGVNIKNMYDILLQEHRGTLILTKEFLEDETENPNYVKIQKTPELKRFYDFYQKQIVKSQENLPIKPGKFFVPNIRKRTGVEVLKTLITVKTSEKEQFVGNEELYADVVPTEFLNRIPADKKSRDLGASLLEFMAHSINHEEMSDILPKVRILQEEIGRREYIKSSDPKTKIKGYDSNLWKMVDDYINMQVKGNMKFAEGKIKTGNLYDEKGEPIGEKYIIASDVVDLGLRWNSLLRIGLSPITATANVLFGDVANIIESVGGRFFSLNNLRQATNVFFKQTFEKESDLNKWLEKLNPLQELDDYQLSDVKLKKMSLEKLQEYMYLPQKKGEKFLQSRTMIAILIKEGYMTPKGETTEKGNNISDREAEQLSDKVQRVNQMIHGRYSQREAATLQQSVLYRLVSQFRKWIPSAIESRLGAKQYDVRLQVEIEGRYRTFFSLIKNLKNTISRLQEGKLTELEIYNMRKMLVEITLLAASILLYAGLHGDDEDKKWRKNPVVKTGLTLLNRVSGDLLFFYSPNQINNLTKNAIPLAKTTGDLLLAVSYLPFALGENAEYKRGSRKGQNKFLHKAGSVIPIVKPTQDILRLMGETELEELR